MTPPPTPLATTQLRGAGAAARAAALLRAGGLVALPTETVYGLAARGLDEACVRRIFAAKGRPADNPVILHVASFADARPLWDDAPAVIARAERLADALWPGPLTIVCGRSALVPDVVTAGLAKVAVRAPAHALFVEVLRRFGEPLAAPSANASSRPSPTTAADVLASLDGRIDAVLDGGPCRIGIESTVVDVTGEVPVVLRHGAVRVAELRALLPDLVARAPGQAAHAGDAAPGLRHKHYAPAIARVELVDDVTAAHWTSDVALLVRAATHARLAATHGARGAGGASATEVLADEAADYARGLYAALYRLERRAPAHLVIEAPPPAATGDESGAWDAVRDRLARAAS